jgi:hypothetical protein
MPEWRIDTLDPRAGLAFASWWNDSKSEDLDDEPTCIFVGAPDFRPEVIANRAIALAAGRGSFQIGLFSGDTEVPFSTPAAVAEFVRRVYLRGGGGDGADGGGGDGPPPRPDAPPDLPLLLEITETGHEGRPLGSQLFAAIQMFQAQAKDLKLAEPTPFSPTSPSRVSWPATVEGTDSGGGADKVGDGPAMLGSAALMLIYEMMRRLPAAGNPSSLTRWQREARVLGRFISALDLWSLLLSGHHSAHLQRAVNSLLDRNYGHPVLDILKGDFSGQMLTHLVMLFLFVEGPPLDDGDVGALFLRRWFEYNRPPWHAPFFGRWDTALYGNIDPVSALRRIPLPEGFDEFVGSKLKYDTSLYHAMNGFMGSPTTILKDGEQKAKAFMDIVLFASACIAHPQGGYFSSQLIGWEFPSSQNVISPARELAIQWAADNAWNWLAQHLPAQPFAKELEDIIEFAAKLRYRTSPPISSHASG